MDITDELKSTAKRSASRARILFEAGDVEGARRAYRACAQLISQLGEALPSERATWEKQAQQFERLAADIRSGSAQPRKTGNLNSGERFHGDAKDSVLQVVADVPKVSFADVAGLEAAKERIRETIIYPFEYPDLYRHYDVPGGGGIIFYGPPGCGKTRIAMAAAHESKAAFIELNPSNIKDKYVGQSERNLKEAFDIALNHDRAIIFIDEMDSLARRRTGGQPDYDVSIVSELLVQTQRVRDKGANVLLLGATNRPFEVDIALRRPGRFDMVLFIPHPDLPSRLDLLRYANRARPIDVSVDLSRVAQRLEGWSCAEVMEVCTDAAKHALKDSLSSDGRRSVTMLDFDHAISQRQSSVSSWYRQTIDDLASAPDRELFADMIEAANVML